MKKLILALLIMFGTAAVIKDSKYYEENHVKLEEKEISDFFETF